MAVMHQAMIIRFYWRMERDHVICSRQGGIEGVKGQLLLTVIGWIRMEVEVCRGWGEYGERFDCVFKALRRFD